VNLTAPSVKRRVDRLRRKGAIEGFRAIVDHAALGWGTEALVELFYQPGTTLDQVARTLCDHPEVVEAWSITGEADAIARVRTAGNADLERLIIELQKNGLVVRTRSQVVLSRLVSRGRVTGHGGAPNPTLASYSGVNVGFDPRPRIESRPGGVPKRSNGADCKSAGSCLRRFESCLPHVDPASIPPRFRPRKVGRPVWAEWT
jgi:DNA-binding Lrp family transcriptional regulator